MTTRTASAAEVLAAVAAALARRVPGRQPPIESISVGTLSSTPRVWLYIAEGFNDPFAGVHGVAEWALLLAADVSLRSIGGNKVSADARTKLAGHEVTVKSWLRAADAARLVTALGETLDNRHRVVTVPGDKLIAALFDLNQAVA